MLCCLFEIIWKRLQTPVFYTWLAWPVGYKIYFFFLKVVLNLWVSLPVFIFFFYVSIPNKQSLFQGREVRVCLTPKTANPVSFYLSMYDVKLKRVNCMMFNRVSNTTSIQCNSVIISAIPSFINPYIPCTDDICQMSDEMCRQYSSKSRCASEQSDING